MNGGRIEAIVSALIAVVAMAIAWKESEGAMVVVSLFTLVFGAVASKRCSLKTNRFIAMAAVLALICTILSVTVLAQDNFTGKDGVPTTKWFVIIGLVHTAPVVPLTFSTYVIIASVTGASYNWALVGGLSPFIGMGIEVPGFVLEYFFEGSDNWMVNNGYILYHFLMTAMVLALFSYYVADDMKHSRLVISTDGLEETEC